MPQTSYLPCWKAEVPILAPVQKPGGVTISTTLWAHAVPNKPQWSATEGSGPPTLLRAPQAPAGKSK